MIEDLKTQLAEFATKNTPAGIVMSPWQLRRLMAERDAADYINPSPIDDRYTFMGLPIWRSWEITGPAVVSHDVLKALRKMGRWIDAPVDKGGGTMQTTLLDSAVANPQLDPVLF